jgi:hypothetical protein
MHEGIDVDVVHVLEERSIERRESHALEHLAAEAFRHALRAVDAAGNRRGGQGRCQPLQVVVPPQIVGVEVRDAVTGCARQAGIAGGTRAAANRVLQANDS